jgi:nitrite reductase/ring-hydroxylating ferredoxin subunit
MDISPRHSRSSLPPATAPVYGPLGLPERPAAWFVFCASRELDRGPVARTVWGRQLVAFRTQTGRVGVLDARCVHMGSSLAHGEVVGESIRCPFHHWQFGIDGVCTGIPATGDAIPEFARQQSYPAQERNGCVFFFGGDQPDYALPFFDGVTSEELAHAAPFTLELGCPWYMVGANGIDVQHFRATHGRRMLGPPLIEHPHPLAHRATTRFEVVGNSIWDCITRSVAGPEVTMRVTDWGGTLFFVEATFRRTQTFGMVSLLPLARARTLVMVTVAVKKRQSLGGWLLNRLNARIRRRFIQEFLAADVERSQGTDVNLQTLIDADRLLKDYYCWLQNLYAPANGREATIGCGQLCSENQYT